MITAIGAGIGDGDMEGSFNVDKVRYHKIVIMTDADVDGSHIRTLLLTFFCRHMPELVKAGFLYIAQPPLYLVTRRKVNEYVQDDNQLNRKLIELGANDVFLKETDGGRQYTSEELRVILETLINLSRFVDTLVSHGGDFKSLLEARIDGKLPDYIVKVRCGNEETIHYIADETALNEFAEQNRDLGLLAEISGSSTEVLEGETEEKAEETPAPVHNGPYRRAILHELHEAHAIARIISRLGEHGISANRILSDDKPIYEVTEGEGDSAKIYPLFSVMEILDKVIEIGRRGVDIKRFKGLGEMNAKELFSTTMDPATRQLLKVEFNESNYVEADRMFTILMGDIVEPRKRYIEDNALNVRNLDI